MAQLLTTFDPTNPTSGNFVATFNTGKGTLHIKNASAVDVGFSIAQAGYVQYVVQAGGPRDIPVPFPKATIYWTQQAVLANNNNQLQSVVYVESYECHEEIPASHPTAQNVNIGNVAGVQTNYQSIDGNATGGAGLTIAGVAGQSIYLVYMELAWAKPVTPTNGLLVVGGLTPSFNAGTQNFLVDGNSASPRIVSLLGNPLKGKVGTNVTVTVPDISGATQHFMAAFYQQ